MDQPAETRMDEIERETEFTAAEIRMGHGEIAGREPLRQRQSQPPDLKGITGAVKLQRLFRDANAQRHADAEPDIFLKARRPCEAFCGMNDLRKAVLARADAGPDLAAAHSILGDRDDHGNAGLGAGRQRPADHPRGLRKPPTDPTEARLVDLADIDDGLAVFETLRE